jgi:hypothetical protein
LISLLQTYENTGPSLARVPRVPGNLVPRFLGKSWTNEQTSEERTNGHCTMWDFSSNFPVSKNLSNEVGMKMKILYSNFGENTNF